MLAINVGYAHHRMSLDGDWTGNYRYDQPGPGAKDCAFSAHIRVKGQRILGSIEDRRERVTETSYRDILESMKHAMSAEQRSQAEAFLRAYPDSLFCTDLALTAQIDGQINGAKLMFVKRYSEPQKFIWKMVAAEQRDQLGNNHEVWYDGKLSPDGQTIEGTWYVRQMGFLSQYKAPLTTGTFQMEKT